MYLSREGLLIDYRQRRVKAAANLKALNTAGWSVPLRVFLTQVKVQTIRVQRNGRLPIGPLMRGIILSIAFRCGSVDVN